MPAKALGDEFAVAPVGLQVAPVVRDTHRSVAEYLQGNSKNVIGNTNAKARAINSPSIKVIRRTRYRTALPVALRDSAFVLVFI